MVGFQSEGIFGKAGCENAGKSDPEGSAGANPQCPQCGSQKVWRDGHRLSVFGDDIQRWLCRDCGLRFSDLNQVQKSSDGAEKITRTQRQQLKSGNSIDSPCQICDEESKNLGFAAETKTVAGDKRKSPKPLKLNLLPEVVRGYIAKFEAYLERNGYDEHNTYPSILIRLAGAGANLLDPESVKAAIAKGAILDDEDKKKSGKRWSNSMKAIAVCAYGAFCKMEKIIWDKPVYHQDEIEIIPPKEKELELLIASAKPLFATFLRCLKETFADPSEVLECKWSELKDNVLFINHPVKRHNPGYYELSDRLMRMLNALPHEDERIFPFSYRNAANNMRNLRRRAAKRFDNPAVLLVSLKSFRHWGERCWPTRQMATFLRWLGLCATRTGRVRNDTCTSWKTL